MSDGAGKVFAVGDTVGRYRLVALLDRGGMATVWAAEGPSGPVALKVLGLEAEGVRERFELEARALLKLRHPNVVRAVDYGRADDGTPFVVMERLVGEPLAETLHRDKKLPVGRAVAVACAAGEGLAAAHALGIVHRDVKPANLFVCADGTVKVLDFGIAFWGAGDGRMPVSRITVPGTVMGTPSYMAPEQASGVGEVDERTDVWGLAAVLYHALAGREPFGTGLSYLAELTRIVTEPPDPLPDDVPPGLGQVIFRALAKARADRPASMDELVQALRSEAGAVSAPRASQRKLDPRVMGALTDEVRLVSAALVLGLDADAHDTFLALVRHYGGVGSPLGPREAVAVFGGEAWLGDEAERAVRMGLEVRRIAERIAVGTGRAVRRMGAPGAVTGAAVAAAERVLAATAPRVATLRPPSRLPKSGRAVVQSYGTVVACPATQERIMGAFDVAGARVLGARAGARALGPREVAGRTVPFVGREAELARLLTVVEGVREGDDAAVVVVTGPPGIGKSRLRFELLRRLTEAGAPHRHFEARGELAHASSSFGVVCELVRRQAELPEGSELEAGQQKIEALVASAELEPGAARGVADFLGELLGVPFPANPQLEAARGDPQAMADRIRLACADLFAGFAAQGLVLVSLEDAQWADTASLALLAWLADRLRELPLVVVATARPTFFVERDAWPGARRIELAELGDDGTARIVEAILGRAEPTVVERAAGNPYLAEELCLAVREGADPDALPLTVEGAVLARLDKLAPDEKDLLKRAAVLGRSFWREGLEALGEPLAGDLLGQLRRRELLLPSSVSRLAGCEEWMFRQAVVYEVCRGLVTDEQRRALHQAAGSWLSRRSDAAPEQVAEHFEAAGAADRAALWWIRAVHAAHARASSADVVRFGAHVLALGAAPPTAQLASDLFAVRLLRAEAFHWLADAEHLTAEVEQARALAAAFPKAVGDRAGAPLLRWRAHARAAEGDVEGALRAATEAMPLADAGDVLELRVLVRATLSDLHAARGELVRAAELATEGLDLAKRGAGSMIRATAARALADVEARLGQLSAALLHSGMARTLCLEVGAVREATLSGIGLGACLTAAGDHEQARKILDKTLAAARSLGLGLVTASVEHHLGRVLDALGDRAAAREHAERALAAARSLGDASLLIAALEHRSKCEREAGDAKAACASAELALAAVERHQARSHEAACRTRRAQALVALGRPDEALGECERALEARDAVGGMLESEVELLLARHDALAALGRDEQAKATLRAARKCFEARLAGVEGEALRDAFGKRVAAHVRLAGMLG
ncbi:MAG: AAA family ATPase [Polyangiaceae bacterium]|nr:AAA family ATPase [Polyangiaceae bacterium]